MFTVSCVSYYTVSSFFFHFCRPQCYTSCVSVHNVSCSISITFYIFHFHSHYGLYFTSTMFPVPSTMLSVPSNPSDYIVSCVLHHRCFLSSPLFPVCFIPIISSPFFTVSLSLSSSTSGSVPQFCYFFDPFFPCWTELVAIESSTCD
jgi:hypothetical protein